MPGFPRDGKVPFFSRVFFNRLVTFTLGFVCTFAYTNPDPDRFWEIHPAFEQRDYAYLNFYEVDKNHASIFENNIKCLTRYLQTREGYGYTRVIRLNELKGKGPLDKYQYVGIQTWFSRDMMEKAMSMAFSKKMISKLYLNTPFNCVMYKIVADDDNYIPR